MWAVRTMRTTVVAAGLARQEEGVEGVEREEGEEVEEVEAAGRTRVATAPTTTVVTMEGAARVVRPEEEVLGALDVRPQWLDSPLEEDEVDEVAEPRLCPLPLHSTSTSQIQTSVSTAFSGYDGHSDYILYADWNDPPAEPQPPPPPAAPARKPPSSRGAAPKAPEPSSLAAPKCECGDVAVERTVKADTVNKGRLFWACPNNRRCDFFEWADGPSSSNATSSAAAPRSFGGARSTSIPAKRSASDRKRCLCELSAVLKETKNGNNKGKWYWSCPNESAKARCKFFEWATDEEVAEAQAAKPRYRTYENRSDSRGSNSNHGGGGGASGSGACFKVSTQKYVYGLRLTGRLPAVWARWALGERWVPLRGIVSFTELTVPYSLSQWRFGLQVIFAHDINRG